MYTVYVLQNENGKLYKGMTHDIHRRIAEHRRGKTKTTRFMQQIQVVYSEEYETQMEARSRELYLKTAAGRKFLKTKLCARSSAG